MVLVSMERGELTIYYGTKQLYFGRVKFNSTGRGGKKRLHRRTSTEKGLEGRGLRTDMKPANQFHVLLLSTSLWRVVGCIYI